MSYGRNNIFGKFIVGVLILGAIGGFGYYFALKAVLKTLNSGSNTPQSEIVKSVQDSDNNSLVKPGDPPMYVLLIEVKQVTATLDIGEHIKNNMNSQTFEYYADKRFYDAVDVGQDLYDNNFKFGSLMFNGDASWLKLTVVKKMVVESKSAEKVVVDTIKAVTVHPDTI